MLYAKYVESCYKKLQATLNLKGTDYEHSV